MVTILELIGVGLGMASLFGLIVGVFSVYNGRATRRELSKVIAAQSNRTQEMITEESKRTREIIVEESTRTQEIIRTLGAILERMDRRLETIEHRK